jgi:signal transduction histidine kinase
MGVIALAAYSVVSIRRAREPRFDGFSSQMSNGLDKSKWQTLGGTWRADNGTIQNISDDRGARLMNGSSHWRNYVVDTDVQLLGEAGDAGILIRSSQEETGVDSYHGYFAGLRDIDETLILGRADYGWHEFQTIPVHSGVHAGTWFHLRLLAYGCDFVATATTPTGEVSKAILRDPTCLPSGRFGLQSYSTGAVWKNLQVRPATEQDLEAMLAVRASTAPEFRQFGQGTADPWSERRFIEPMLRELRNHRTDPDARPIADLRLLPSTPLSHVTVDGVVTLVSPTLFVQDASGGVAVATAPGNTAVQIGDAVEVNGDAEQHDFSSTLRNASVRLLWSHAPVAPVSVTAAQAATGGFDAQYIETEGRLVEQQHGGGSSVQLRLMEGSQPFLAIAESAGLAETLRSLEPGSRLRVRGICVTDRAFAHNEIPFAVLMHTVDDAKVIEPPPWWGTRHEVELFIALLAIFLAAQVAYTLVKRSQWRAISSERERLALEMHDTLAQSYAGLGFQLEALCRQADPDSRMRRNLEATVELVRSGHQEARRNIAALRPTNLERMGLAKALELAAYAIVRDGAINVSMSVKGEAQRLPQNIGDVFYRIGQEAIANAVRHGKPGHIRMKLIFGKSSVMLMIRDDGAGFSVPDHPAGFGIRGMMRRAERIHAQLHVRSLPGAGTTVVVRAELPKSRLSTWWKKVSFRDGEKQRSHEGPL